MNDNIIAALTERTALCEGTDTSTLHFFTNNEGTFCPGFNIYSVEHEGVTYAVEADNPHNVSTNVFFKTDGRISIAPDAKIELLGENPCAKLWKATRDSKFVR